MTITNNRAAGQAGATKHSSLSLWAVAAVSASLLCIALPPQTAHAGGNGLRSGIVCPAAAPYRVYVWGAWRCYADDPHTAEDEGAAARAAQEADRAERRRQKHLRRTEIPCRNERCSPAARGAGGSSNSAMDRLGGGTAGAPSGGGQSGGRSATRSSAGTGPVTSGGGPSAPNIGISTITRPGGTTPGQSQSSGLR